MPLLIKGSRGKELKLQNGEFKWRVKNNVCFVAWQDNKEALLMSNDFHSKVGQTTVTITQKNGSKISVKCPLVTKEYTQRMDQIYLDLIN
ncbi:unnamed protein product [Parnassius apollo]|uniref:(apollo) hypothetical protein n=1 Tax=Parnassius apollo TaxID=110799 RepID=A0A8S3VZC2_PARAO|nr:unnamed protein product [Parnassius apollo]